MPLVLPLDEAGNLEADFVRDFQTLCRPAHYKYLSDYVAVTLQAFARAEVAEPQQIAEEFASQRTGIRTPNVVRSLRVLRNLSLSVINDGLTGADIRHSTEELASSFEEGAEAVEKLARVVDQLASHEEEFRRSQTRLRAISGVLPMFVNVGATIDARVLWGKDDQEPPSFVPIASIGMEFDSGDPDSITFQITPASLRVLIENLQQVEERLKTVAKFSFPKANDFAL